MRVNDATSAETRRLVSRWRLVGLILLIAGLLAAPIDYWMKSRHEERLGDILPGYDKSIQREVAIQMGPLGLVLMQWSDALSTPAGQALLIAASAAIFSRGCYFVAKRLSENE